jgi:hypothetical protein
VGSHWGNILEGYIGNPCSFLLFFFFLFFLLSPGYHEVNSFALPHSPLTMMFCLATGPKQWGQMTWAETSETEAK